MVAGTLLALYGAASTVRGPDPFFLYNSAGTEIYHKLRAVLAVPLHSGRGLSVVPLPETVELAILRNSLVSDDMNAECVERGVPAAERVPPRDTGCSRCAVARDRGARRPSLELGAAPNKKKITAASSKGPPRSSGERLPGPSWRSGRPYCKWHSDRQNGPVLQPA